MDPGSIYRFGPFCYDPWRRELRDANGVLRVGRRALQLLEVLLQAPGRLHDRDELIARVWPDSVVDDSSLRVHMSALRRVLGDGGRDGARYIANVSGRGYVFVGHARAPSLPAPTAAPAPAAWPALPARLTTPVGRDRDLARIAELLQAHRLVSIVGAGGMGKTTVALAAAEAQGRFHEHGAVFVDLSTLSEASLVVVAVGQTLGLDLAVGEPWPMLERALRGQELLIILDNCEHVVDAVAALAERLLQTCPSLQLLATSREPLEVQGEWVFRLPALDAPALDTTLPLADVLSFPAIELFVERARATHHAFDLSESNVLAVRQICHSLDGIPLAIELAAARVHSLGVAGLIKGLASAFELLTRGRRTAMARHHTLQAVMDWSHELLSTTEREVLQRLAVFRSAFDLNAAVAVAASPALSRQQVIDGVLSLYVKSLLVREDGGAQDSPRHRLLYITRLFAEQRLANSSEATAVHRRHAVLVRDSMAARSRQQQVLAGLRSSPELASSIAETRAAIEWTLGQEQDLMLGLEIVAESNLVAHSSGLVEEFGRHLGVALDKAPRAGAAGSHLIARLQLSAGLLAAQSQAGSDAHRQALKLDRSLVDQFGTRLEKLEALKSLCTASYGRGDYRPMLAYCDEVDTLAQGALEPVRVAVGDRFAAMALHALGRHVEAQQLAVRVMQLDTSSLEPRFQSVLPFWVSMSIQLARIQWLRGEFQLAWQTVQGILARDERDHVYAKCHPLGLAAIPIAIWRGELAMARRWTSELMQHAAQGAFPYWQAYACAYGSLLDGRVPAPGSPEARLVENNTPLMDTFATLQSLAPHPATLARVRAGEVGWCAPEVLRLDALDRLDPHSKPSRARCVGRLHEALALSESQGARFWSLRIASSLCDVAKDRAEAVAVNALLRAQLDTLDDGSPQPDLQRARDLLARQARTGLA
jgi:predicted ATPase/DNA-binding winged helix-turn-helix (wHTH) protein